MNVFFTADLHLGHDNIRRHCRRPFATVEEMDEAIIANWNGAVASKDLVYIVGDFAWRNHGHHLARLRGKKILIKGNHDKMSQDCLRNFTEVHQLLARTIDKHLVVMCHYCMVVWPSSCHGAWHLYGHSHGRIRELPDVPRCDVGVDVWDFAPVPWDAVKRKLEGRKRELSGDVAELDANIAENVKANRDVISGLTETGGERMKRSPSPVADRSPEWPCLPKGQDLTPKTYRRSDFRPVPAGLATLLHSLREFEPTAPRPHDHIGPADSIAATDPFTVLLFTEPLAEGHWGRKRYMAMRRVETWSEIDETISRQFGRELDERMSDYLKDHRDPDDAYLESLLREYRPKARAFLRAEYRERYPRAWRQKWRETPHEQPRAKLERKRRYEMPEPLGIRGAESAQQFYFMSRAKTFDRGCGTGSGSRESHSYFALAFLELQRRGLHIPSYILVYDRDNRLRFVDAWSVPLVLPYEIGCNCSVDRDVVRRLVDGAWKATARRRRDWTGFVEINVWKDRDPTEGPL